MKIGLKTKGSFQNVEKFFDKVKTRRIALKLNRFGTLGVAALAASTPIDTGETAQSWKYEVREREGYIELVWYNDNRTIPHKSNKKGIPIVVLIRYGHATKNGGYVMGRDFISPTIQPIFDKIAKDLWDEVTKL